MESNITKRRFTEMKVSIEELRYKQSRPLFEKIEMSQCVIETWWKHWDGKVYISFSGGKDSTVLLHLVRSIFPEVPAVFADTGLEYPELKEHIKSFDNVTIIRPKMSYRQVIDKYGYPIISKEQSRYLYEYRTSHSEKLKELRIKGNKWGQGHVSKKWLYLIDAPFSISHKCCEIMKKNPFRLYEKQTSRKPYLGILAQESRMRTETYLRYGCNAFDHKRPMSSPMSFWTDQDVFGYLLQNNLKLPSVYGDIIKNGNGYKTSGIRASGCMWCAFGIQMEKEPNKFQRMKVSHPKIWHYAINDMGLGEVLDYIHVPYE